MREGRKKAAVLFYSCTGERDREREAAASEVVVGVRGVVLAVIHVIVIGDIILVEVTLVAILVYVFRCYDDCCCGSCS